MAWEIKGNITTLCGKHYLRLTPSMCQSSPSEEELTE
uniref:MPK4 n=1 Tax=Arundo donax TaxID=35708 RepID=A0A0A9BJD0_ARUDO